MISLTSTDSLKWKNSFGTVWDKLTESCPYIGGFMINHEERHVIMDNNARTMAGLSEIPEYSIMMTLLNGLIEQTERGCNASVEITEYSDNYTIGFFRASDIGARAATRSILPVCEAEQLMAVMSEQNKPSLLALIEVELINEGEPSEFQIFTVLSRLTSTVGKDAVIAYHSNNRFYLYIPDFSDDPAKFLCDLREKIIYNYNDDDETATISGSLTFSAGIGADSSSPSGRMNTAEFALYEATQTGNGSICVYSAEQYTIKKNDFEKMNRFTRLVDENLFKYHFQPIVDAKNGEVIAYELLMRTDSTIGMYPLEILECAKKSKRLYDIERATLSNALSIIAEHQDLFKGKKLFVNSITAHMLTDEDWDELIDKYGVLVEKMVVEFTEQTEISDSRIDMIKKRLENANIKIAIDDYGTGYSNTSNLMKYSPDYVKIDRSLIEDIDQKPKVRRLVAGIIDFIHENGYLALAEGVETFEELQTMILLGSDLIQGYYTSKPKPVMLHEISENVSHEIKDINLSNSNSISRSYHPSEGEIVDIAAISEEGYNSLFVEVSKVTLKGSRDNPIDMAVFVKNDLKTKICLKNINFTTDRDYSVITVGDNSETEISVTGVNLIKGRGIYVPQTSTLRITGDGNLKVRSESLNSFGIGTDKDGIPGNIYIAMNDGSLTIEANGDTAVAIGGGKNPSDNKISIKGGEIAILCSGRVCVGIGNFDGGSIINLESCRCSVEINSPELVGVGSLKGATNISAKSYHLSEKLGGIAIAGVGSIKDGSGRIDLISGTVSADMRARVVNCIGSRDGSVECYVKNTDLNLYSEGGSVSGLGDMNGSGDIILDECHVEFEFHTGDGIAYGSKTGVIKKERSLEKIVINS